MKKILLIVAVLMLATPALAVVEVDITAKAGGDFNEIEIWYNLPVLPEDCADGNRPRAFGLNITVTNGSIIDINAPFEGECDDVNRGYGIFPGTIAISGGEVTNYGSEDYTPVAPNDAPGAEDTGLDTNTIVVEMGSLYTGVNCPDPCALLFTFTVDLDCNVSIAGNAARTGTGSPAKGVVLENLAEVLVNFPEAPFQVRNVSRFVPDVVGMQYQPNAEDAIVAENLVVGNVTWTCSLAMAAGEVISTDPVALTEVQPGWEVDLLVSRGDCDWGDADDPPYPTLSTSNGAVHVATGVILGVNRDTEADGQPNASATGDDFDADFPPNDEDGVVFGVFNLVAISVVVEVTADCNLNAWVDFDDNGNWDGVGEQVFTDESLAAGFNQLIIAVPAGATRDTWLISRWRVNYAGGLGYTGLAGDGEVEDYNSLQVRCHVPDVVGDANLDAQAEIITNGFTIGNITAECNDFIAAGLVISTDPTFCHYGDYESPVDLVISTGSCCTYPPCWDWLGQCKGDAHGDDGDVDTDDLLVFKPAFGGVYPAAKYDPCADFDKDGDIDTDDLLIFKPNFGQTGLTGCTPGDPCGVYCP